jgi:hypothetical protein
MVASSVIHRKQQKLYLSAEHRHHVADCEYTIFSVVEDNRKPSQRRSSRERSFIHSQSLFTPEGQGPCVRPAFYIALHKQRFHVTLSGCDETAARAIQELIKLEEQSRQRLESICADMSTVNAMSVRERVEHEMQYREVDKILSQRAQTSGTFSSLHWSGSKNPFELRDSQSHSPCLLCKFGQQHAVRVLRLDLGMRCEESRARASFADQQDHMLVDVLDEGTRMISAERPKLDRVR